MSKFDLIQHRAMELAGHVSDSLRHALPSQRKAASTWLQTGAALGAARMATRTAGRSIRRHPAVSGSVVLAVVAGAGLLWWASKRRKEQEETRRRTQRSIQGSSSRISAEHSGTGNQQSRKDHNASSTSSGPSAN